MFLEAEVLKLASILENKDEIKDKIEMLKSLATFQNSRPECDWKFQRQTLLELAKGYEKLGELSLALSTYSFITETAKYSPSPISLTALLQEARLKFNSMAPSERKETNPEMVQVLNNLKELQIKKQALTEPVHLEAAIDYASIRAELSAEDERFERHLFFLERAREDFRPSEDQISVDYYNELQKDPQTNHIFQLHMGYLDAEILHMKAKRSLKQDNLDLAQNQAYEALKIVDDLLADSKLSTYLQNRALETKKALGHLGI